MVMTRQYESRQFVPPMMRLVLGGCHFPTAEVVPLMGWTRQVNLTRPVLALTIRTMYIVTRYVVAEILKYFLAALIALTVVVTPVMGVKEGLNRGFPPTVILATMPYMLPEMLEITVPVALLLSVCTVFGRMTGSNEVVALKSLGISPMSVIWPAIVLAAFLSLGTVCLYEIAATWGKPNVLRVGADSLEEIAYSVLQKEGSFDSGDFSIQVKRIDKPATPGDPPTLVQPTIVIRSSPKMTIFAEEARFRTDTANRVLHIECYRGKVDAEGRAGMSFSFPGLWQHSLPLPPLDPHRYDRFWVASRDVGDLVAELQSTLRQLQGYRDSEKALGIPESEADTKKIIGCLSDIRRLKAEPYRRWANGFTCLCFALIGTPVAMLWRHADVLTNFFVCFLPILAIYYPLLMLSNALATSPLGHMPPISFWTANVVLATPAIALLRWVVRH